MGARCTRTSQRPKLANVTLHIYDVGLSDEVQQVNNVLRPFGMGAFHCGVEVYGWEWSFRGIAPDDDDVSCSDLGALEGSGIFCCRPRSSDGHVYREALPMGKTALSETEVLRMIQDMQEHWSGKCYDILTKNCCHFSDELCRRLGVGSVPDWVLSLAGAGAAVAGVGDYLDATRKDLAHFSSHLCCSSSCGGMLDIELEEVSTRPVLTN
mmetsp:Transcript_75377/g.233167  ORF Transcript_75377/g.233167 Transcript_75377/m.233167 type:complete len:210 (-) Transcript_75377:34-663(-)